MPIMEVHYPAGRLDAAAKAGLAKKLTDVLILMEGGAGTDGGREFNC
jgi:phenylpyruvate tautomerase PptA (4-oxalocrotonate tautomerase family)